jgi:hypothetical protein
MVFPENQPAAQIARPRPQVGDRQGLLLLPLAVLQPVQDDSLRLENDHVGRIAVKHRNIENAAAPGPKKGLVDCDTGSSSLPCGSAPARHRHHHHDGLVASLADLGNPEIIPQVFRK